MQRGIARSRWAAIGAAVAVSLGAGGIALTSATSPTGATAFVPITPCRVLDSRPAPDNVGNRNTPIGSGQTHTVSAHGNNGACTGIPVTATGLSLNVTAVGATAPTFLTFWPTGAAKPTASNLNPTPGQPPTPNAVTTGVSAGGQFDIFNFSGSVNVIVDIVGYYTDHQHTGADIVDGSIGGVDITDNGVASADIADSSVTNGDTSNEPGVASSYRATPIAIGAAAANVSSVGIRVPSDGFVDIEVTGNWVSTAATDMVQCQLQKGTAGAIVEAEPNFLLSATGGAATRSFSAHRMVSVNVADNPLLITSGQAMRLTCLAVVGSPSMDNIYVTATFYATSYAPLIFLIEI